MGKKPHDAGRDRIENERYGIAPSLAFGLDTPTRLYLNYLHVRQNNTPGWRDPYRRPAGLFGAFAEVCRTQLRREGRYQQFLLAPTPITINLLPTAVPCASEHDLTENTTVRNTTRWSRVKQEYLLTAVMGGANNITAPDINDVNTWSWSRLVNTKDVSNRILTNQTNITSTFDTGSIGHDVSAGVEFTRENQTNYGVNARTAPAVNLYHPVSNLSIGGLDRNGANANGQTDTFGIYAFDTLTLTERIEINGGLRLDNYHTKYDSATACGGGGRGAIACPPGQSTGSPVTTVDTAQSGNLVNWKAGALYRLTEQGNVLRQLRHLTAAAGRQRASPWPPAAAGNSANRTDFKPQKAKSSELGTKWQIFDNRLLLSAALFRTDIENEVAANDDGTWSQYGKKRVEGYELSATGNLTPDWTIIAGYTQQHATVTEGQNVAQDGSSALAYTPETCLYAVDAVSGHQRSVRRRRCALCRKPAPGAAMVRSVPRITPRATGLPTPNWAIGSTETSICSSICITCLIPITWPPSTRAAIAIIRANPGPLC